MSKILVVDDDLGIRMIISRALETAGHEVLATGNPHEVISLIRSQRPDAVTLDVMMPGVSGLDLLEQLRADPATETLPVLLLTALSEAEDRVRGLRGGADDYLVKPFDIEELLARIDVMIARTEGLRVPTLEAPQGASENDETLPLDIAVVELEWRIRQGEGFEDMTLGRYEVKELIGTGAMGRVFRAWDPKLRRQVALKTLRFDQSQDDAQASVSQLLEEAVISAAFNHPNIVTVYDVEDEGAAAFIAMELVEGSNLKRHLHAFGPQPPGRFIPLAAAVSQALAAAHAERLLHRDVKPGNVLLGVGGEIKVTDFGVAEMMPKSGEASTVHGTPGYIAPETLTGRGTTAAGDLFALGVVLYECASGVHPFGADNWTEMVHHTISRHPPELRRIAPRVPQAVSDWVVQLLEKDPADRPTTRETARFFAALAAERNDEWTYEPPPPGSDDSGDGTKSTWSRGATVQMPMG